MIAQRFGVTRNFLKEWHSQLYARLKKITCGFKDQVRARHLMEHLG